MAEQVNEI